MDELGQASPAIERAGDRLRVAREAKGLSLDEVATRTRVPLRHLAAIEASNYAGLPSHTYATGFAKAYARAVGLSEVEIARDVREEVDRIGHRVPEYQPYVTSDPARVPSRGLALAALALALILVVVAGLWFGTDLLRRGGSTAVPDAAPVAEQVVPAPAPTPAAPTGGQVVLTATDEVWMRVYDAADQTLYLGTMRPGERFEVPANADRPMINVGRPDQLKITLNGSAVPPLGDGSRAIKDIAVDGAAIAARAAAPAPTTPAAAADRPARRATPQRARAPLTETQRANLESARQSAR
jgi:transcriptional regulator with XRE-family HTH domain